jgi:3-hydroxyacyl-CoA dehydrogenase / enoyl-CoA hydratase / 3-hydroxybutyryl-CoA epimerase
MSTPAVSYAREANGIGWIVFDQPGTRANVLSEPVLADLANAIDAVERDATLTALVIESAKERIFIAGAELKWIASLQDEATAFELSRRGQRLFQRLAELRVPVVCAIHGACAGGGFELALACDRRIASDAPVTQIGLPETGIGVIPGWGGTTRLPRVIGVERALEHILRGALVSATEARAGGLVDDVVPPAELHNAARQAALRLAQTGRPVRVAPGSAVDATYFEAQRLQVRKKTRGQLPALAIAIDAMQQLAERSMAEALEIEARHFARTAVDPVSKNLIHAFFLRDAAKKRTLEGWFEDSGDARRSAAQPIRRVGVIGAGVMGSGIAHWLALQGIDVVLSDADEAALSRGLAVIRGLFDGAVKKGKLTAGAANAALGRICAVKGCGEVASCELVIEAIIENVAAKRALFAEIARTAASTTILASNTSALPLEEIGADLRNPDRLIGVHFFNPVSRMPLVELILGRHTSLETASRALALVKALGKTPIICRSSPGFLVTRVLFFYLNEAVRWWEAGAETSAIDAAMRDFGWPMGPLRLIDEVGVDVTDFIFGELAHYFPNRFVRTAATEKMLAANLLGRKNGASRAFYRYPASGEIPNDDETRALGKLAVVAEGSRTTADIAERLMRVMVDEAERCLAEGVVKSADDVDFALLSGAGFPAFRGGLLRWAKGGKSSGKGKV